MFRHPTPHFDKFLETFTESQQSTGRKKSPKYLMSEDETISNSCPYVVLSPSAVARGSTKTNNMGKSVGLNGDWLPVAASGLTSPLENKIQMMATDHILDAVLVCQRVVRGFLGRRRAHRCREYFETKTECIAKEYYALVIQRYFRGYLSRMINLNLSRRKSFLQRVTAVNARTQVSLLEVSARNSVVLDLRMEQSRRNETLRRSRKRHHMLSTITRASVFSSEYTGPVLCEWGVPMETLIKELDVYYDFTFGYYFVILRLVNMSSAVRVLAGTAGITAAFCSANVVYAREQRNGKQSRVWMTGTKYAIPNGSFVDLERPTPISWFSNTGKTWSEIVTGPHFGAALSTEGQVYVWAYDNEKNAFIPPRLLNSATKINQIVATEEFIVTLSGNGSSMSVYDPSTLERMGTVSCPSFSWFKSNRFVSVSAGRRHIALVDKGGRIWTAGDNSDGQCGRELPKNRKNFDRFNFFEEPKDEKKQPVDWEGTFACVWGDSDKTIPAKDVACGGDHTVIVTADGKSFAFGDDSKIQLGLGDTRSQDVPDYVPHSGMGRLDAEVTDMSKLFQQTMPAVKYTFYDRHLRWRPTEMKIPKPEGEDVRGVVLGDDFTVLKVGDSGLMLACGQNQFGQCGRGLNKQQQTFAPVKLPRAVKPAQVSCGSSHCIASLEDGSIYAWGANTHGQIGTGNRAAACPPVIIHKSKIRGPLVADILTEIGREPHRSKEEIEEFIGERKRDALKSESMLTREMRLPEPPNAPVERESAIKQDLLVAIDKTRTELGMTPEEQEMWNPTLVHASYYSSVIVMEKNTSS
jgi:alpha-tubulin suppressor-like RCC1 family protein